MASAIALGEVLEPVIEAVTDRRPARVLPAARRAQAWWDANRARLADTTAAARAMGDLKAQAADHHTTLAARAAVMASTAALDACSEPPSVASRMMRIDLAGMAGWLRAHGVSVAFPHGVSESASAISDGLRANGQAALADRLTAEVAATLAIPVRIHGDVRTAIQLLERVDEVEKLAR